MNSTDLQKRLDLAISAGLHAGDITLEYFQQSNLDVEHKRDGTPVTIADRQAEDYLRSQIETNFSDDAILNVIHAHVFGRNCRLIPPAALSVLHVENIRRACLTAIHNAKHNEAGGILPNREDISDIIHHIKDSALTVIVNDIALGENIIVKGSRETVVKGARAITTKLLAPFRTQME